MFVLLSASMATAANYTWVGGAGGVWTTAANWEPARTTPAASDVLVFARTGGGNESATSVPTQTIGQLIISNNAAVTLTSASGSAVTLSIGSGIAGPDLDLQSGSALTLANGGTSFTVNYAGTGTTGSIAGTLTVNSGVTWNVTTGTTPTTTVSGTVVNAGTVTGTAAILTFGAGGKYQHSFNGGGTIPTATWSSGSTCEIIGYTSSTTAPGGLGQTFGNFTWNCPSQTVAVNLAGALTMVAGNFTVTSTGSGSLALTATTALTLNVAGSLVVNAGTLNFSTGTAAPTINVAGNVQLDGGTLQPATSTGVPVFNLAGHWINNGGTFTPGTGTVTFNSVADQTIGGTATSQTFNHLTVNKPNSTLNVGGSTTTLVVNGNFIETQGNFTAPAILDLNSNVTLTTGTFTAPGAAGLFTVAGNWTNNGATFNPNGGRTTLNGTAAQTIAGTAVTSFQDLEIANTSATVSAVTNLNVAGTMIVNANATFSPGAAVVINSASPAGRLDGSGTILVTRIAATPDLPSQYRFANYWFYGLTVNYAGAGAQTISDPYGDGYFAGLQTSGSGTKSLAVPLNVSGNLAIGTGTVLSDGGSALTVKGNVTNAGTHSSTGNGEILCAGTGTLSGTGSYGNVRLNWAANVSLNANTTISGKLTVDGGTLTAGAYALSVSGPTVLNNSGTLAITSATGTKSFADVTVNGGTWNNISNAPVSISGNLALSDSFLAGTNTYTLTGSGKSISGHLWGSFSIPRLTVTGTYANEVYLDVDSLLTVTSPGMLTNNHHIYAATSLAGTGGLIQGEGAELRIGGTSTITTLNANALGNLVQYEGTTQTIHNNNYYDLTLYGSGTKTLQTGTTSIAGNLQLAGSTIATVVGLTIGGDLRLASSGSSFTAAGYALTVNGNTEIVGGGTMTIASATGAKIFKGPVYIEGVWANSGNSAVTFRGGIDCYGGFTAGTGVHTFDTNPQTLTGTLSIPNVTVTGVTLTNNGTLTVGTALSGTGGLIQGQSRTLELGGSSGITTLDATAWGNTVNYSGAAQAVHANNYYLLTLSGSGTKTLQTGTTNISGGLTLTGTASTTTVTNLSIGNLNVGSGTTLTAGHNLGVTGSASVTGTLTLSGANTFSSGLTLNSTGLLNLNSTTALGGATLTINGGTLNNTSGSAKALAGSSPQNWNGNFTFTGSSSLDLGNGPVTMNANPTVTNSANTLTVGGVISGNRDLTKTGPGTLALTGNNTFNGLLTVQNGTLSIPTIHNINTPGPLGQNANPIFLGGTSSIGTLQYTGTDASPSCDRPFEIGVTGDTSAYGGVIQVDNSGTTLTLNGSIHRAANGLLTKSGAGKLLLGGASDNTDLAVIANAGTLVLAKNTSTAVHAINGPITNAGALIQLGGSGGRSGNWDQIADTAPDVVLNSGIFDMNGNGETIGGLSGTGGTILNNGGGLSTLTLGGNNGISTYSGIISNSTAGGGALTLVKTGTGVQILSGANTYTGNTTIKQGGLTLNGRTGRLADTSGVTFTGTGTFNYDNVGATAAISETVGPLTRNAGEATIQSTRTAAYNVFLTFSSFATRGAGATANFVNSGGTLGTQNKTVLTGQAAGFIDQGTFFGGNNFAWYDSGGWVRGLNYGTDANSVSVAAGATVGANSGKHVKATGGVTAQTSISLATLNLSGAYNFTLAADQTLTLSSGGLLKAGNNAAIFSGGAGLTTGGNAELVARADQPSDTLTLATPILSSSTGGLTKSGLGTVVLSVTGNAYTGPTVVNAGTLDVQQDGGLSLSTPVRVADRGTLRLNLGTTHNYISDSASVHLDGTGLVVLDFNSSDTVDALWIDGVKKASGTWGGTSSGATHIDAHFAGPGTLNVISGRTPVFSSLPPSQSIEYGTTAITLGGNLNGGSVFPPMGAIISVTINGVTRPATVTNATGDFSVIFPTATIPYSATPYPITYAYAGDDNLNPATDSSTTLTVLGSAPVITVQPASLVRVPGDPAAFAVSAVSACSPFYQWRFNGVDIPGATSSDLVIPNVQFTNAGSYTVMVSNCLGAVTSAPAVLSVISPKGGELDLSFDPGSTINGSVQSVAVQSDGKVLIGGNFTAVNGVARNYIARLNSDGSVDTTFQNGLTGANNLVQSVAVQADGKVLIGGAFTTVNGVTRNYIARLNGDGSVDTTFQNGLAGASHNVYSVAVQADGKVLIGGVFSYVNGVARNFIARLNSDGSLDPTFVNGLVGASGIVQSLVVQGDGKVLIGGDFNTVNGVTRNRIARLNNDGSLDTTFQNGLTGANNYVTSVAVQGDGKVLIGGAFTTVNSVAWNRVARLNSDGSLDTTFQHGLAGANNTVYSVAVQPDGKVLIGGNFTTVNGVARNFIARLNSDGTLDTPFLNGLTGANGLVISVGMQPDGKVLIGGNFTTVNGVARNFIARLNSDGTLDTTFQNGLTGANNYVTSVVVQSDGKVLIGGGFTTVNDVARNYIARLNSDGSLDTPFLSGLTGANNAVASVAVQGDGKVLIGGGFTTVNGVTRNRIARLNSDGSLDTTFQNGLSGANNYVYSVAVQPDGKVLIGGNFTTVNGVTRNRIARLNSDGSLDTTFQNGLTGANNDVYSLAVQPDGKVLIGGNFTTVNGVTRNRIARLNSDGSLDTTFQNGLAGANQYVRSVAVQGGGKLVIGGVFTSVNGVPCNYVAQLWGSSANADLASLALSTGTLSPAFSAGTIAYSLTTPLTVSSLTVTPTSDDPAATIQVRVNGGSYAPVASGTSSSPLLLIPGTNSIDVQVTSADTTLVKTYTVSLVAVDTTPPEITCPADVTINTDPSQCYASNVALGTPTATDNFRSVTITNNAPVQFPIGTNTVTWTAFDPSGNTNSCPQLVIVRDSNPPVVQTPPASRTNNVGTTASFSVSATGCTPLSYQWLLGAALLTGETNATLTLPNVQWEQRGLYSVIVTSEGGSVTNSATLTVNRLPVPVADSAGVSLAQTLTIPALKLAADDSDPDGDPLTVTAVTSPSTLGATVSLADGLITYHAPVSGTSDSFTYTVSDGRGGSALGTVNVTLSGGSGLGFNQLTPTVLPGGDLKLNFLGIPGLRYALDWTHDLGEPEWTPLMTNQVMTNGWLFFTNRPSVPGPDFYRTRHVP